MITVTVKESTATVTFSFNNQTLSAIRKIPQRQWDSELRHWTMPAKYISTFLNNTTDSVTISVTVKAKHSNAVLAYPIKFKTTPFDHQIEGINYSVENNEFILGDEQGLGKTWQVINIARLKKKQLGIKHCLIICCVNILKWNWEEEINLHADEKSKILGIRTNSKGKRSVKNSADIVYDLKKLKKDDFFLITNIETLRNQTVLTELKKLVADGTIGMIAVDEAHRCKNPSSQQSKGLLALQKATVKIPLTGTILLNSPLDLYVPLKFIGAESHSFYAFKNYYCVMGGYGNYQVMGYRHLQELQNLLQKNMLRRLKRDVLNLPEKMPPVTEYVEMYPEQAKMYQAIRLEIIAELPNIKLSDNPLAKIIRLRQTTAYTGILSEEIKVSAKFDRALELIADIVENGDKCLVVSNWQSVLKPFKELISKYNPAEISGQIKDEERITEKNKFMTDDSCKVLLGTISAMGAGLTLTAGNTVIFLDSPWNQGTKDQVIDRIHRIGTKGTVTIITLVCKDTIDEKVEMIVSNKGMIADSLVDCNGNLNAIEMMNFLLDV